MDWSWDDEQLTNANIIIHEGVRLGASQRDIQIALMTAMTESNLHNYSGGDRDSVGLFQQRDAWGTFAQRHDPATAADMFFQGGHAGQRGLFDFPDRDAMGLGEAAQAVQVSAFPDRYAEHQSQAEQILQNSNLLPPVQGGSDPVASNGSGVDDFAPDPGSPITQTNDDGDGLTDEFEKLLGTDPTRADTDHDGLSDVQETYQFHTDPLAANNAAQVDYLLAHPGSVAHDPAKIPLAALQAGFGGGATLDSDHDGLSDLTEVQIGSNAYQADTDHDGVSDGIEHRLGSDLLHLDTDNDGIVDAIEYEQGSLAAGLPDATTE
jgi:hypothetical protein